MEALVRARARVHEDDVGTKCPRDDLEQRDPADERVDDGLEDAGEWLGRRVVRDLDRLVPGTGLDPAARRDRADEVQEPVEPDARERGAAQHGLDRAVRHAHREGPRQLRRRRDVALEVPLHQGVVGDDDPLDEVVPHAAFKGDHVGRHGAGRGLSAVVADRLVGEQVDEAAELRLGADRERERRDTGPEGLAQPVEGAGEVGPLAVELVHEHDPGHASRRREPPDRLRLDLDALDGAHQDDGEIGDVERQLDLTDEVDESRRVDQVDLVLAPGEGGDRHRDRDVPLHLLGLEVRDGRPVLDAALARDHPGEVQQGLGKRRLSGSTVPDEDDVPDLAGRQVAQRSHLLAPRLAR